MVIDGHAHACGVYIDVQSIEKYLTLHNIDMVILSGCEPKSAINYHYPMFSNLFKGENHAYRFNRFIGLVAKLKSLAAYIDDQNEVVYRLAKAAPQFVMNTYWANPLETKCMEKVVGFYPLYNFKMIKLHQCFHSFDIEMENCSKLFSWAGYHNMPVFIHIVSEEQIVKFANVANTFKNTTFIVAHLIGAGYLAKTLKYDNVYFDLSSPQLYSADMLKRAVCSFGVNRLILGSDVPYGCNNIEKVIARLHKLKLGNAEMDLIKGDNLKALLALNDKATVANTVTV